MNKKIIYPNSSPTDQDQRITWADFKRQVEAAGVKDDDYIDSIDVSWGDLQQLDCTNDDVFGWQIKL